MGASLTSKALLSAAVSGLLCAPGCGSDEEIKKESGALADAGSDNEHEATVEVDTGTEEDSSSTPDSTIVTDAGSDALPDVSEDSSPEDAATLKVDCDAGAPPDGGTVTLSVTIPSLPVEQFTADCDAAGGTVEIHPHCGGFNSCQGMSYDSTTQTYSEHTCKGLNTCTGYSCVLCDYGLPKDGGDDAG